ncbi:maleylpyruvate isomerase family mycothiol-dependent enzyme [Streptosporangium sp. CA-135522]|uniref:maleylpyruvate isomerase family mycothiol-dependent enzyme n=1 Tax=Streptosporangium sp. CA-135522 TaxID=3240072 RepID=UPI003D9073C0
MTLLGYDRYCDEITTQTDLLRELLKGADLSAGVPTCPGWTLAGLVRHIGGNLRTGETAVRTGQTIDDPGTQVSDVAGPDGDDPAELDAWLAAGAARYAETLRKAGPDTEARIWTFHGSASFWVRRALHDLVIHRADAAIAVGADYAVVPDLAADAVDELLELFSGQQAGGSPQLAELRGPVRSIHLHATDAGAEPAAEWLIELGPDGFTWRHGHEKATVALRGPLTDVLLVFYRRLPAGSGRVEVLGESALLDLWLDHASLG